MSIDLVNFTDVEILEEGTYACDSGVHTFTREDLQSAVKAASEDAAIKDPRLKLGHVGEHGSVIGLPAVGRVTNLRFDDSSGKAKVIGDVVGVPAWLAEIMPTAYPNRSIEGNWDVTTSTGNTHKFVIKAISNLGVDLPAVETLEDLQVVFEEGPDGLKKAKELVVAQFKGNSPVTEIKAATQKEVQGMTPEQIKRLRKAAGLTEEQLPDEPSQEQISSAYDALDARVESKPEEKKEEKTEEKKEEPKSEETKTEEKKEEKEPEPVAAKSGKVYDEATIEQLKEDAKAGREARAQQLETRRHGKVEAAIQKGKIPPSRREHYQKLMAEDEDGTTSFLDSLEDDVIPVQAKEKGSGRDSESTAAANLEAGIRSWFPELSDKEKEKV